MAFYEYGSGLMLAFGMCLVLLVIMSGAWALKSSEANSATPEASRSGFGFFINLSAPTAYLNCPFLYHRPNGNWLLPIPRP